MERSLVLQAGIIVQMITNGLGRRLDFGIQREDRDR